MSDRLTELRRQRALVQEHLAWLDRELAALESASPTPANPLPPHDSTSPPRAPFVVAVNTVTAGDKGVSSPEALPDYRVEPEAVKQDVRKGCLLYFAAAFALLIVMVAILYVALSSR